MQWKKIIWILFISLVFSLFSFSILTAEEEIIDPKIPESWYEPPKTISELNISEFYQSPVLDKKVEEGELPPVIERLPEDPIVVEPYDKVGKYGGTVVAWDRQLNYYESGYWQNSGEVIATPDGDVLPFFIKDWQYSDDYTEMTLLLRKGIKWSDGETFDADDYMYWWNHVANNEELTLVPPEKWDPPLLEVRANGRWKVTFKYGRSFPNKHLELSFNECQPAHYMKQFHPDFVEREEVEKLAEEQGLENWYDYYGRIYDDSPSHPEYEYQRPVLVPYIFTERSETHVLMERNPYYPVIDTAGNQLPYIDNIRINLANDEEMAATKAATGEATFAARHPRPEDIPLYKKYEARENYRTVIYRRAMGSDAALYINHSHPDLKMREIFQNVRFRRALSLAIDRDEINRKVYYGEATPRQTTVPSTNRRFREEFAQSYAEYDPERAEEMLDEIGLVDINNDGYRERPDGEKFNPTLIYCKMGPVEPTRIFELVKTHFSEIGIDLELKKVSRELWNERWGTNNDDISSWTINVAGEFFENWRRMYWLAPVVIPEYSTWPGWASWYSTDGEEGVEPPEEVKKLIEYAKTTVFSPDAEERFEAGIKLLEAQAENLWTIGTVGMGPQPIIVSNTLKNIPEKGLWGPDIGYLSPYHPEQFYLEE